MGAGAGPGRARGGGRACSYIKKCVGIGSNAVSELNTEGKSGIFFRIFSERYLIFPSFSRIFPEGKIRRIGGGNPVLSQGLGHYISGLGFMFIAKLEGTRI